MPRNNRRNIGLQAPGSLLFRNYLVTCSQERRLKRSSSAPQDLAKTPPATKLVDLPVDVFAPAARAVVIDREEITVHTLPSASTTVGQDASPSEALGARRAIDQGRGLRLDERTDQAGSGRLGCLGAVNDRWIPRP